MAEHKRVLIVARTRMGGGRVCIGALSDDSENLRLLSPQCGYQVSAFQVGELWDISFNRCPLTPPHIEDVAVIAQTRVGVDPDPRGFILQRVTPWTGLLADLFGGLIRFTGNGAGYISERNSLPANATAFWFPQSDLHFDNSTYAHQQDYRHIKFVGFQNAVPIIQSGQLVRVSLAKWWKPQGADERLEERCYVQLSGWFL